MALAERKFQERQIELERVTQRLIVEDGLSALSIERIAARSGYSRPTIYQHFSSKDDAIRIVALKSSNLAHDLVRKAILVDGRPRERAVGLVVGYELLARFHPDDFYVLEFLGFPWLNQSLPEELRGAYREIAESYFGAFHELLESSLADGQLSLPDGIGPRQLAFQTVTTTYGILTAVIRNDDLYDLSQSEDFWRETRTALHMLWDGAGWEPLSAKRDYEAFYETMLKEVYPEYWLKMQTETLAREINLTG